MSTVGPECPYPTDRKTWWRHCITYPVLLKETSPEPTSKYLNSWGKNVHLHNSMDSSYESALWKQKHRNILWTSRNNFLLWGCQALAQRGCGPSHPGDIQKAIWKWSWATTSRWSCLGLDQRSFQSQPFCDRNKNTDHKVRMQWITYKSWNVTITL